MEGAVTLSTRGRAWKRYFPPFLRRRLASLVEAVTLILFLGTAGLTYFLLSGQGQSYALLTPPIVALLLVANLVPAIAL
ncbi:MAG TPA: PAS domain-containing sensor histidine kinase, partial [Sphingobium sp.]